jgi:hypothetical protein
MFPVFGASPGSIQGGFSERFGVIRSAVLFRCLYGLRFKD